MHPRKGNLPSLVSCDQLALEVIADEFINNDRRVYFGYSPLLVAI
jgi:hypothetical protein